MDKFVPYEKMNKRQRRALDKLRRKNWNGVCPVTRIAEPKQRRCERREKHRKALFAEEG